MLSRRQFLINSSLLAAGAALPGIAVAGMQNIKCVLRNGDNLAGLSGAKLRSGLLKSLTLEAELKSTRAAQLFLVTIIEGKPDDVFVSGKFKVARGKSAFPGENFFPGDDFFPGDNFFPGDDFLPTKTIASTEDNKRVVTRMAAKTFSASKHQSGLFLVVLPVFQPEAGSATGQGIALSTRRG